ncbi:hypothetical protein BC835DRAFT_1419565 [Cytidiella melzeri]|nr:hypothetical protein BC835DRAFT_1419565 [Cytidiella melzeri]
MQASDFLDNGDPFFNLDDDDNEYHDGEVEPLPPEAQLHVDNSFKTAGGPLARTTLFMSHLSTLTNADIALKMASIIEHMASLQMDVTTFLHFLSWNLKVPVDMKHEEGTIRYARTALMHSEQLPGILKNWHKPPRPHSWGVRTTAARNAMDDWALENVTARERGWERRSREHDNNKHPIMDAVWTRRVASGSFNLYKSSLPAKDLLYKIRYFHTYSPFSFYTKKLIGEEEWVAIGVECRPLPDRLGAVLWDGAESDLPTGLHHKRRHPNLYSPDTEWRGYTLDGFVKLNLYPDEAIAWPYDYPSDLDNYAAVGEHGGQLKFLPDFIKEAGNDLREAQEIVSRLQERGGLLIHVVNTGFRADQLATYSGIAPCLEGVSRARLCLLDLIGAIARGLDHVDAYTKGLLKKTRAAKLCQWLVNEVPKMGFVLDMRNPKLEEVPILDLLRNNCPLYFPWSARWRPTQDDEMLRALSHLTRQNFVDVVEESLTSQSPLLKLVWDDFSAPYSIEQRLGSIGEDLSEEQEAARCVMEIEDQAYKL